VLINHHDGFKGLAKEARRIREWMVTKKKLYYFGSYYPYHEMGHCDSIRGSATGVMDYILRKSKGYHIKRVFLLGSHYVS
jgi:hypothetical protein